jgi:hypothetical protein
MLAGHSLAEAMKAFLHNLRTCAFVLVLWALFASELLARTVFCHVDDCCGYSLGELPDDTDSSD